MTAPDDAWWQSVLAERDNRAGAMARRTDPATSKAAAVKARKFVAPTHAEQILGILWRPMTPPVIAKLTGLSIVQIDRRRRELVEAGRVRLTGREVDGYEEWEQVYPETATS